MRTYRQEPEFFAKLAVGPEIRAVMAEIATKAKGYAEGLSQDFRVTGDYADSFDVTEETIDWEGRNPGRRAAARLVNTSGHAAAVEWGYKGRSDAESSSAHRVLGRTAAALRSL